VLCARWVPGHRSDTQATLASRFCTAKLRASSHKPGFRFLACPESEAGRSGSAEPRTVRARSLRRGLRNKGQNGEYANAPSRSLRSTLNSFAVLMMISPRTGRRRRFGRGERADVTSWTSFERPRFAQAISPQNPSIRTWLRTPPARSILCHCNVSAAKRRGFPFRNRLHRPYVVSARAISYRRSQ
jgi:hypothetical protein